MPATSSCGSTCWIVGFDDDLTRGAKADFNNDGEGASAVDSNGAPSRLNTAGQLLRSRCLYCRAHDFRRTSNDHLMRIKGPDEVLPLKAEHVIADHHSGFGVTRLLLLVPAGYSAFAASRDSFVDLEVLLQKSCLQAKRRLREQLCEVDWRPRCQQVTKVGCGGLRCCFRRVTFIGFVTPIQPRITFSHGVDIFVGPFLDRSRWSRPWRRLLDSSARSVLSPSAQPSSD